MSRPRVCILVTNVTTVAHSEGYDREGSRSFSAVFFALGLAGVPPGEGLAGPVLVRLLGDLGQSEAAARSALLRMRRVGLLTSTRTGRGARYGPSAAVRAGHARHRNQFTGSGPEWDGGFHALLVSVPESDRGFRDELRRAAARSGYRTLRPGLLIAPSDRTGEMDPVLSRVPSGASLVSARLQLSPPDTCRVAADLWRLDDLAARYRSLVVAAREAVRKAAEQPPAGPAAVRGLAAAALPSYEAIADDPGLPADLLPSAWPGSQLSRALGEALRSFGPPVSAYIDRLQPPR